MKILVANLGSTSFKYRLFDMADERVLARGGVERIGSDAAKCFVEAGGKREEATLAAPDHAVAVRLCLDQLTRFGCLMNGCCYGRPTNLPWAIHFPVGHETYPNGVHPTELYESFLGLGLYAALAWFYRRVLA